MCDINKSNIIKNILYLSLTQAINVLFPILMYGYFIKIIGESIYGEVLIYQAVVVYFSLIINYGFNISGVKKVADCGGDFKKISVVFSSILYIKSLLFIAILVLTLLYCLIFSATVNAWLLFLCSIILVYEWLFQQWFFQAIEKLKFVFILSALSKIIAVILLFLFLKSAEDFYLIPLFMGLSSALVGVYSLVLSYKLGVQFVRVSLEQLILDFKDASFLFLSTLLLNIKGRADIFFVGLLIGLQQVVYFDFILKLLTLAVIPIGIINNAFFARSSSLKDTALFKRIIFLSFVVGIVLFIGVMLFKNLLLRYVALDSTELSPLITPIAVCIILLAINITLELNGLIAWGYKKIVLIGATLNLVLYLVGVLLIALSPEVNLIDFVYLTIVINLFDFVFRVIICFRYKLLVWNNSKDTHV